MTSLGLVSPIVLTRLKNEKILLDKQPLKYMTTYQDNMDIYTWYFLIKGQENTPYFGGEYIGKLIHDKSYPAKPPKYFMLTPSGRFQVEKEICLSNSSWHPETWSPSWNIKSILISFDSIFVDDKENGAGFVFPSPPNHEREALAKNSISYNNTFHNEIYSKFNRSHFSN